MHISDIQGAVRGAGRYELVAAHGFVGVACAAWVVMHAQGTTTARVPHAVLMDCLRPGSGQNIISVVTLILEVGMTKY